MYVFSNFVYVYKEKVRGNGSVTFFSKFELVCIRLFTSQYLFKKNILKITNF